ncbi:MAG: metal-dependent hydrolase [Candidatus Hadarchaeota archaeon]
MILAHLTVPLIIYGAIPQLHLLSMLVGANISSLDALPTLIRGRPPKEPTAETHAATVLHTLFFFAVLSVPLYLAFGIIASLSFTLGGFTHIFIDAIDEKGRMLLYPFSKKFCGLNILTYDFWTYTTNKKILATEATLFFIASGLLLLR